jgi:hypothetical protein
VTQERRWLRSLASEGSIEVHVPATTPAPRESPAPSPASAPAASPPPVPSVESLLRGPTARIAASSIPGPRPAPAPPRAASPAAPALEARGPRARAHPRNNNNNGLVSLLLTVGVVAAAGLLVYQGTQKQGRVDRSPAAREPAPPTAETTSIPAQEGGAAPTGTAQAEELVRSIPEDALRKVMESPDSRPKGYFRGLGSNRADEVQ